MTRSHRWLALLLLAGCVSAPTQEVAGTSPAVAPSASEAPAPSVEEPDTLSNDVHWVRSSAEHRAIFSQTFRLAAARLEDLAQGRPAASWAVAVDADETLLDNSRYQRDLLEKGESFSRDSWFAWVRRQEAPALPGAHRFLTRVRDMGGLIAVVTNRREEICAPTRATLAAAGLPFDVVLCRPGEDREKEPRWARVEAGSARAGLPPAEILLWLGDNMEDFPNLDQELRSAPEEALALFGDRYFVLPNPMYGSWVGNPPG